MEHGSRGQGEWSKTLAMSVRLENERSTVHNGADGRTLCFDDQMPRRFQLLMLLAISGVLSLMQGTSALASCGDWLADETHSNSSQLHTSGQDVEHAVDEERAFEGPLESDTPCDGPQCQRMPYIPSPVPFEFELSSPRLAILSALCSQVDETDRRYRDDGECVAARAGYRSLPERPPRLFG